MASRGAVGRLVVPPLVAAVVVACGGSGTEVVVHLDVDDGLRPVAGSLGIDLHDTEGLPIAPSPGPVDVEAGSGTHDLPVRLVLAPRDGDVSRTYRIGASLETPHGRLLGQRRAMGGYTSGQTGHLWLVFDPACEGRRCLAHETCFLGTCVDACVEPEPPPGTASGTAPVACPASRAQLYVDAATGVDGGDCASASSPCETVGAALSAAAGPGAIINVRGADDAGNPLSYAGFSVATAHSGTPDAPTVVRAWPGTGQPLVVGASDTEPTVDVSNASHVILDGLAIRGGLNGVFIHGDGRGVVVRHCSISGNGAPGMSTQIEAGITVIDGSEHVLEANDVFENGDGGGDSVPGIRVCATEWSHRVVGNRLHDNQDPGLVLSGTASVVRDNVVYGNGRAGILVRYGSSRDLEITNNRVCGQAASGILVRETVGTRLSFNTVVDNGTGVEIIEGASGTTVENNIVAFNGVGVARADSSAEPDHSHNLYFANTAGDLMGIAGGAAPGTDVFDDPELGGGASFSGCEGLDLAVGSPARDRATNGQDLGAD